MKIKWEKKDDAISVAFVKVSSETSYGKPKQIQVALRVDGRSGDWRVDMATAIGSTWTPFEAIDNGKGLSTEAQAKAHAAKWLAAANDQKTVHPTRIESKEPMPSLRSDMLQLLGETDQETFQTRRDAGPTSTGVTNKPAKKTPVDKVKPPRSEDGAGDEGEASATATPTNSPAQKKPMKAGVKPPNVTGAGGNKVENAKREARIYAGIDNKYGIKPGDIAPEPEDESYLSTIKEDVSEDPILKIAREAMKNPFRSHPFE